MSTTQIEGLGHGQGLTSREDTTMRTEALQAFQRSQDGSLYKEEAIIGNGAYGTVYKAHDVNNPSTTVAIKKVRIPMNDDGVPVSILREISLVRQLDKFHHPNIVRFLDVCTTPPEGQSPSLVLFLVFEFVEMDLSKYIKTVSVDELSDDKIKDIMFQLLCGVDFLHSHRILHRDLKPQNLLITASGQVKLADFGLAKIYDFSMRLTTVVVTLWYRSPELLLGASYASPVDIWSVGCILAELYRRHALFKGSSEKEQLERILDVLGTPKDEDWPSDTRILPSSFSSRPQRLWNSLVPGLCSTGEDLLSKLLAFNPSKRLSARDALKHPYFHGLSEPILISNEIQQRINVTPTPTTPSVIPSVTTSNPPNNRSTLVLGNSNPTAPPAP